MGIWLNSRILKRIHNIQLKSKKLAAKILVKGLRSKKRLMSGTMKKTASKSKIPLKSNLKMKTARKSSKGTKIMNLTQ